jgi:type II secretory pathway pseudopilin PulG
MGTTGCRLDNRIRAELSAVAKQSSGRVEFRNRPGYTLVEMLALISVTGLLMSLAAICMQRSVQAHKSALDAILYEKQLDALYSQLKSDLAQALSVTQPAGTPEIEIIRNAGEASQEIEYSLEETGVRRTVYGPEDGLQSAQDWSISVVLLGLQIDDAGSVPLASVRVSLRPSRDSVSSEELTWLFRIGQESRP